MNPRGHRGLGALLVLIVLFLGTMALLPLLARAAPSQIVGLVDDCNNPTSFIGGAKVTLSDANGVLAPVTVTTAGDGTFAFTPATGSYLLSATASGYYPSSVAGPLRFDGTATVTQDLCVSKQNPNNYAAQIVTVTVTNGASNIAGATINVYNTTTNLFVVTALTGSGGTAVLSLWQGTFQLRTNASGYAPTDASLGAGVTSLTVTLLPQDEIIGHARSTAGGFLSSGLVAYLYNPAAPTTSSDRLIAATINGSLYDFHAPAGTYTMIVDSNGYAASVTPVTVPVASNPVDSILSLDPKERDQVTFLYGASDWNNVTVWRNLTLNPDSTLVGLGPSGVRDLRLQIDATLGNGDGVLGASEATAFDTWFAAKGPLYVTTDAFLLTNGKAYISAPTFVQFTVTNLLGTGPVWINASTQYSLKSTPLIAPGGSKYYVNVTAIPDTNTTSYHNMVYYVQLPRGYEMTSDTLYPPVTVNNYTRVEIDPGLGSLSSPPQVKMVVSKSFNGTARAKLTGPVGKFYVTDSTYQNYHAYAAANTNLNFSAADSTDPVGDITKANFTWHFDWNKTQTLIGYGITPTFKYTAAGEYIVNLTVTQAGGNVTYREITLWLDNSPPTANFRMNITGTRLATDLAASSFTLMIKQGTTIKFDASPSSDLAYPGKTGVILNSGYAWNFRGKNTTDATGRIANWTFNAPGYITMNLTVTDAVGWKSANVSLKIQVNDTQAPVPAFQILDPTNDYSIVAKNQLIEKRNYTFNASTTTDNYDKWQDLNYTWTIPGPLIGLTQLNHTFYGVNITFGWNEWNNSYNVKLVVRDTGFGSGKPNNGTLFENVTVQVDTAIRPDLKVIASSLVISNTNPEEGQTITVTVNVTDKTSRAAARAVVGIVQEIAANGQVTELSRNPTWSSATQTIASGSTVTLTWQVTVVGTGNKTIKAYVYDQNEPSTWVTSENWATQGIVVKQAAWVNYAIVGSVVGVFAVFIFAMYYRRKVKAGEWQPRRRREKGEKPEKKEKGGEGEKKGGLFRREKEVTEEKKRL